MASNIFSMTCSDGMKHTFRRRKQGRGKSPDPKEPITIRLPRSWFEKLGDKPREKIVDAVRNELFRTQELLIH